MSIPTLNSRLSPAAICRANEWTVGTRLIGDEGYGPATIEITAIGETHVLAKRISPETWSESSWSLSCREWTEVKA